MQLAPQPRAKLIGDLAFAVVVLAAFSQFVFSRRLNGEPWQVVFTFTFGAAYATLGVLANNHSCERSRWWIHGYYALQCGLAAAAILISPTRGIFFILAMPVISQAVFDYGWRISTLITLFLFGASIASFWIPWGFSSAMEAAAGYFPAFLFTLICVIVTKEARIGKSNAERMSGELAIANEQLRAHAAQAEELATTRERNRLAREIHDGVGHYLTTIKVQLDAAVALLPRDPARAADSVSKAARLAAEALEDVRRSVGSLAPEQARPPLVETLRQLATDGTPAPSVQVEGTPRAIAAAAEHALFRSAQEGLTNVRKHAVATTATLTVDFRDPSHVRLAIVDNGRGPSADPKANGQGCGLRGLHERIALLGGTVKAGGQPGGGFRLEVEVPA